MKLPSITGLFSKMFHTGTAPEGAWRPTAGIGELGNIFSIPVGDGFQRNLGGYAGDNTTVYALVQCYVMALGAAGLDYRVKTDAGGYKVVTDGPIYQLLKYPNSAQTQIEFISWLLTSLFYTGNFYAWAKRNEAGVIYELWPLPGRSKRAVLGPDGSLFYDASSDYEFMNKGNLGALVPARDMLHIKLPSSRSFLNGDSLITHGLGTINLNSGIIGNANALNENASQPSGVLSTDLTLTGAQMIELRQRFEDVTKGPNRGGVPILGGGLKWYPMGLSASDSQLIQSYNLTVLDLCRLFRVPIQVFGQETNGAASSVEALINQWRASGLLYYAEIIEAALERLLDLGADQEIRTDLDNIARADTATMITTLATAVQNGIFSPDEARNKVGLDTVPFGDSPRVQAQNVRLQDAVPAPSAPSAPVNSPATDDPEDDTEDEADLAAEKALAIVNDLATRHADLADRLKATENALFDAVAAGLSQGKEGQRGKRGSDGVGIDKAVTTDTGITIYYTNGDKTELDFTNPLTNAVAQVADIIKAEVATAKGASHD